MNLSLLQIDNLKRDVAQLKDEKHLERNKNEQLNVEIEEFEAKCGLYKHNTEKLNKNFENEVCTECIFNSNSLILLKYVARR